MSVYRGNIPLSNKRKKQTGKYMGTFNSQDKGKTGRIRDLTKRQDLLAKAKGRKLAQEDLENIKKTIDLSDTAQEALFTLLTVMRTKGEPTREKINCAAKLLEFTLAKPVAKTEVTINQAEAWLKSLSD